jgi:hypothetical protein
MEIETLEKANTVFGEYQKAKNVLNKCSENNSITLQNRDYTVTFNSNSASKVNELNEINSSYYTAILDLLHQYNDAVVKLLNNID